MKVNQSGGSNVSVTGNDEGDSVLVNRWNETGTTAYGRREDDSKNFCGDDVLKDDDSGVFNNSPGDNLMSEASPCAMRLLR